MPLDRELGLRAQPDQRLNAATRHEQNPQEPREIARSHARGRADGVGLHHHKRHDTKRGEEKSGEKIPRIPDHLTTASLPAVIVRAYE
jgi:hypothetical protein